MYKHHSPITFSFGLFLAGALALSGVFFTQASANDVGGESEIHIESSVVSQTLTFIAEHGTSEEKASEQSDSGSHVEDVVMEKTSSSQSSHQESESHEESHESTHGSDNDSHDPSCPVSGGHSSLPVTLVLSKIVCANESDLPNWGMGGPDITANTAGDFLASHPSCHPVGYWGFQWGNQNVTNPGDDFLWDAGTARGWTILGQTNTNGVLTAEITLPPNTTEIRVREMLEPGYLPFSYGANHQTNVDPVSAELYCDNDVLNYDNFDFVRNPVGGKTYHCVAWNVRKSAVNNPPVITLVGANPMTLTVGTSFVDPGATSTDPEDGVLTPVVTGTVNTAVVGSYTIRYTATDSGGLSVFVERTVNVIAEGPKPVCADGIDNDTDGLIDFPVDLGCTSATDTDENDAPIITVIGLNPFTLIVGTSFVDPGATSTDKEDGVLIPVATGTVNTTATGTYTITYTATDSKGLTATATRTVNVVPAGASLQCSDGIDNDLDGTVDFPADAGCTSGTDNDENNAPIITLVGSTPVTVVIGNSYTDQGATAQDAEDGTITANIIATGTVNTSVLGTYAISFNVMDSKGLAATEVIRTVNVVPASTGGGGGGGSTPPKCANGQDDDADGKADYPADPGCTSSLDDDETDTPVSTGGGGAPGNGLGGGAGTPGLQIFNERLSMVTPTSAKITWNTNLLADSRVVYGDFSKNATNLAPQYGYPNTTATSTVLTASHEITVTGLPENGVTFFRPVSRDGVSTVVGIELVTPAVQGSCTYLEKYLRIGYNNDPVEVTKLQRFLKEYEGFTNLAVTGYFDIDTDKAVRSFQDKYGSEVLTPWGLPSNTGYVYYTTKKKVNEIYCQRAFPLDAAQLLEISDYRNTNAVSTTGNKGGPSSSVSSPTITVTKSPVVDLSKIDLSDMAPKTPVVTLVPEKNTGEIASGVSTQEASVTEVNNNRLSLGSLLASLVNKVRRDGTTTEAEVVSEKSLATTTGTTTARSSISTMTGAVASALGVSVGTLWVWLLLFVAIIVLGLLARRAR